MEAEEKETTIVSDYSLSNSSEIRNVAQIPCVHCGKYFSSSRGVAIHISRSHPNIHREHLVNKQPKSSHILWSDDQPANISEPESQSHPILGPLSTYKEQLKNWKEKFSIDSSEEIFNDQIKEFMIFLSEAIDYLPGPKHPARKYYEARKQKKNFNSQRIYKNTSNPERATKRDRQKRKNKYLYEKTQFDFYNQRRKAVRTVLNSAKPSCKLDIDTVYELFSSHFSQPNNCTRLEYPSLLTEAERIELDDTFNAIITKSEIDLCVSRMAVDTAPGPDHVLMRVVKEYIVTEIISTIATRMLQTGQVPPCFLTARTVLIHKSGEDNDLKNFRPITICSVVRRVIERALDKRLRTYVNFNPHQRGFTSSPGTIINTSLLRSILMSAKLKKCNATLVFLDIRKAFDNIGHLHLSKTLDNLPIPKLLRNLILKLQENNQTRVEINHKKTKPIDLRKGVMQGSPLSPTLYNLTTDHILNELSEDAIAKEYGFTLVSGLQPLTVLGFADDTVIVAKNENSALELTRMAIDRFKTIGLDININKCVALNISRGKLNEHCQLQISDNISIKCISSNEYIRYLGLNFSNVSLFNSQMVLSDLKAKTDLLVSSPLLHADQKFCILNSSICPSLIYTFQTTPLNKIPERFLDDADKIIKSTLKEILHLPTDMPDSMIYTHRKFKGLGLFRASWESILQQINGLRVLHKAQDPYITSTRNLIEESNLCLQKLKLTPSESLLNARQKFIDSRKVREILRDREFEKWCNLQQKGKGVILYKEFPPANRWLRNREGLTLSEWIDALKMVGYVAAIRAVPGRSRDNNRCRRCLNEIETLPHILGFCPYGEALRNVRHHTIRSMLAEALNEVGFTVY